MKYELTRVGLRAVAMALECAGYTQHGARMTNGDKSVALLTYGSDCLALYRIIATPPMDLPRLLARDLTEFSGFPWTDRFVRCMLDVAQVCMDREAIR